MQMLIWLAFLLTWDDVRLTASASLHGCKVESKAKPIEGGGPVAVHEGRSLAAKCSCVKGVNHPYKWLLNNNTALNENISIIQNAYDSTLTLPIVKQGGMVCCTRGMWDELFVVPSSQ
jgi:hypothetical protein